jgi:glucose-6-phosphate isomerase
MNNTLDSSVRMGALEPVIREAISRLEDAHIMRRIWARDHTVWQPDPTEVANRLGWLDIMEPMMQALPRLETFVASVRAEGYSKVVWMGMGGSSLAADVFSRTFGATAGYLDLRVLDSTDPGAVKSHTAWVDWGRTLFVVATKSGTTAETMSFFKHFYNKTLSRMSMEEVGQQFVAVTDGGSKLHELGEELGFREIFLNDPNIGGRFSVLSYFGMVAAALLGVDVRELLQRATQMAKACGPDVPLTENPGAWLGAVVASLAQRGRDKLTFVAPEALEPFGDWVEQLIAESTGKDGTGILPVVGEAIDEATHYGDDRVFVYQRIEDETGLDAEVDALVEADFPVIDLNLIDLEDVGAQFFLWEMATAVAGHLMDIQPFNQPNVEAAKKAAKAFIEEYREKGTLGAVEYAPLKPETLNSFLARGSEVVSMAPRPYIAVHAYVQPTRVADETLQAFRATLRRTTGLAVTVGYGPRFLHSTGQLHKGDAGNGFFIQFVSLPEANRDVPIPDAPGKDNASISFGVLKTAQALGDFEALSDAHRNVIRFEVKQDLTTTVEALLGDSN